MSSLSKKIETVSNIIAKAVKNVKYNDISFSNYVNKIEKEAHKLYLLEEKKAVREILLTKLNPEDKLKDILERIVDIIIELSTVISNTRRARGGISSEYILSYALKKYGINNEPIGRKKSRRSYYPDVAIPSMKALEENPDKAIALAVKRTLRERWREDLSIFSHFHNAAFVCISDSSDITKGKLIDMQKEGLKILFLPDQLYSSLRSFIKESIKQMEIYELSYLPKWIKKTLNHSSPD